MVQVDLFTDGAAKGNPGPGGYGAILRSGAHEKELSGGFYHTTNNRMELMAVIVGIEALKSGCIRSFSDRRKQRVVGHGRDAVPFGVGQVGNDAQAFLVKGGIGFNQRSREAHRPREVRPHKALWGRLRDVGRRTLARQGCQSAQNEKYMQRP